MQQHTGQHLLSAVFVELFGFETLSFHMGADLSTIELGCPALTQEQLEAAERRSNEVAASNIPVRIDFEDAETAQGLRKASQRTGKLRIVSIDGLDRSACGGTHVRSTGEIGAILLRRTEKIRGNTRVEFVCGLRAIRRARQDFRLLSGISETASSAIDDLAGVVRLWSERLADAEKDRRRLALEVAGYSGRDRYAQTAPLASGTRVFVREVDSIGEETRAEAAAFTAGPKSAYIAAATGKPAVLLAVSAECGLNAGNVLKPMLAERGGRGGGSAQVAQGSVPDDASLRSLVDSLKTYW
jgi:alanyl-tRNA synthetase